MTESRRSISSLLSAGGAEPGGEAVSETLLASITRRIEAVHGTLKAARAPRPRVAVIESLDPLRTAGHLVSEVVPRAGGIHVLGGEGADAVVTDVGAFRTAAPDLLLFALSGSHLDRSARESAALLATSEWSWASGIEAWAVDGTLLTSWPGPLLADSVETIASIVAPALFSSPPRGHARRLTQESP